MPATQVQWNMVGSPRGDGLTEDKPVQTASVSNTMTEVPRFAGSGARPRRVDVMANTAHLDLPGAPARKPGAGSRTPVLLPQSLYRAVDFRYWIVAVGGGMLAWWVLFHIL